MQIPLVPQVYTPLCESIPNLPCQARSSSDRINDGVPKFDMPRTTPAGHCHVGQYAAVTIQSTDAGDATRLHCYSESRRMIEDLVSVGISINSSETTGDGGCVLSTQSCNLIFRHQLSRERFWPLSSSFRHFSSHRGAKPLVFICMQLAHTLSILRWRITGLFVNLHKKQTFKVKRVWNVLSARRQWKK